MNSASLLTLPSATPGSKDRWRDPVSTPRSRATDVVRSDPAERAIRAASLPPWPMRRYVRGTVSARALLDDLGQACQLTFGLGSP